MVQTRNSTRAIILVLTCTFAMVVNTANNTAVSISLSTIGRSLRIKEVQLQWLASSYSLSSGCLLVVFGRIADLYGQKKIFLGGSMWLVAFTVGCGFVKDSITLDVLRGLQGVGAAATIPASVGILAQAFPPSHARSVAFASFSAGAPLGSVLGMSLGGVLIQRTGPSWRSPFFLEAGLTFLCVLGGLASIDPDVPSVEMDRRIDWLGALLITTGLVLIVFGLGQGETAPKMWRTGYIIGLLIVGVLLITLFFLWQAHLDKVVVRMTTTTREAEYEQASTSVAAERVTCSEVREKEIVSNLGELHPSDAKKNSEKNATYSWLLAPPLIKPSLWRRENGRLAVMMFIAFLVCCTFLAWIFWVQLYYQTFLGLSPLHTVLRLLPMFVSGVICNVIIAAVIAHVPVLYLIIIGTLGSTTACLLFAVINPSSPYWIFGFPGAIVAVIGADFTFSAGTLYVAHVVEPHEQSLAGALFQTMTQLGTSLGVTVTTVIFNRVTLREGKPGSDGGAPQPTLKSYKAALWGCFSFGILATLLAIMFFRGAGVIGKRESDSTEGGDRPGDLTFPSQNGPGGR